MQKESDVIDQRKDRKNVFCCENVFTLFSSLLQFSFDKQDSFFVDYDNCISVFMFIMN